MAAELKIPSVGESVAEVEINRWLKSEGDAVEQDEPLAELETDKATLELNAPVSGRLTKVLKQAGETVAVGEVVGYVEAGEAGAKSDAMQPSSGQDVEAKPRGESVDAEGQRAMPAAQVAAETHGVDLSGVRGTGPGGRVLKEDVMRQVARPSEGAPAKDAPAKDAPAKAQPAPVPTPAEGGDREEEVVRMSPMRRRIAERLVEAQHTAALLTTFNEVDMSAVIDLRSRFRDSFEKKHGVRLGFMSFFIKAAIEALKAFPAINAEIRDESIVYRNYYDIGIAVNTPKGLVVPVLRNAERMSFAEIEKAIGDFAKRAQENKLELSELQGGTFTISNGGVFGSLLSTPIINPPQSGILGMHAIQERPVARNGEVVIRPMMYTALSYDHRIVDGKGAVQFLVRIKEVIEEPTRALLEI